MIGVLEERVYQKNKKVMLFIVRNELSFSCIVPLDGAGVLRADISLEAEV